MAAKTRTDEELKQIALDIMGGRIFTDRHLHKDQDLSMVFMVLAMMSEAQTKRFNKKIDNGQIAMVFEYIDRAGPRQINGLPNFMSCQTASKKEVEKIAKYLDAVKDAIKEVK